MKETIDTYSSPTVVPEIVRFMGIVMANSTKTTETS